MATGKTIGIQVAITAIICLLLLWGETGWRQRTQFMKGEHALAKGDFIAAIAGYEAAIHMYTPGSTLVEKSAENIWKIGEVFEQAGDTQRALIAYRSLRSSFYAVHGFSQPGRKWIFRCDQKIARLQEKIRS